MPKKIAPKWCGKFNNDFLWLEDASRCDQLSEIDKDHLRAFLEKDDQ